MTKTILVPVEPTREMTEAAEYLVRRHGEMVRGLGIWEAMIAAAPKPTIPEDDREEVARAICKSRTCEGASCCQWPANMGKRPFCQIIGYYDAADAAIRTLISLGWKK